MPPDSDRRLTAAAAAWIRRVDPGIAGLALTMMCAAAAFAAVSRPLGTQDETAHLDYAYQVWHGHLPVFEHGLAWNPPVNLPAVQWESQHPPLFYLLLAPFVGPLADSGHWLSAVLVGRAICVLIAVAAVLSLAWVGSLVATRNRRAWAIAVPAVVAPVASFVRVGGSVYNDNLYVLLTVLTIGVGIVVIRTGPTRGRVTTMCALTALGMLSRAQFGIALVLGSVCLGLGVLLNPTAPASAARRILRAASIAALPWLSALAAAGWFYVRNKHLTGSYAGGHPDWAQENLGRITRPISQVLTWPRFWRAQVGFLKQSPGDAHAERLVLIAVAVLTASAFVVKVVRRRMRTDVRQLAIVAILVALAAATLASEISYVSSGGGLNSRYLLPAMLPIGCFIASGIVALPRALSAVALAAYLAVTWSFFWRWVVDQHPSGGSLWSGRTLGNVPWLVVTVLLTGLAVGVVAQVVGLYLAGRPQDRAVSMVELPAGEVVGSSP